jgi:hypothetical protein
MRAFEFLIEYGSRKGVRHKKYRDGKKPPWYEKAVKLKTDNPRMTATEIGRQVNPPIHVNHNSDVGLQVNRILVDVYTMTTHHLLKKISLMWVYTTTTHHLYLRKYFDGEKPWWYEEAIALRKQGMTYPAIANKLSTPEERVTSRFRRLSSEIG